MKKKKLGHILLGSALTASLIASSGIPHNVLAEKQEPTKITDVTGVLKNLSDEQRRALKELEVGTGFVIAPDVKVDSPEMVSVIVEFKQEPAKVEMMKQMAKGKKMALSSAQIKVEESHQQFKKEFNKLKGTKSTFSINVNESKITREYRNAFNGVALSIPGNMVQSLVQTGLVKRVWNNNMVQLDLPKEPKELKSTAMSGTEDSNSQIGADKLHKEHITGKGIKVGVIDTGVDYNHPDLKDAYKGGYDFVDNDNDPMETTYKDWKNSKYPEVDPSTGSTYYTSHGTHVSGTIAGEKKNNVDYAVEGVAPEADLYVYRVLGPYGSGYTDAVLAGIDKAVKDGMDVINLSLGAGINDALYPTSVAINNAMLSGVVSVVAAGNAGPDEKTVGSPGASALAITVGASDFSQTIATYSASAGNEKFSEMKLLGKNFTDKLDDLKEKSFPVVYVGLGKSSDFAGKDLTGKLALIQRGEIAFDEKIRNAEKAGAKAVVVYNNVDGEISAYLGESTGYVPTFQLTKADGERLKSLDDVSFTFKEIGSSHTEGDHLADFSSRGPVEKNYDIKPDVVAPGVAVFSTYPEYMNDPGDGENYDIAYTRMQGTSMASPHVAGSAALILQEHPDYTPFEVKEALMNTADELKEKYSVNEVGAGRIDTYEAVHANTSIKVIDKTKNMDGDQTVEIDEETGSMALGSHYQSDKDYDESKKVMIQNKDKKEAKEFKVEVEYLPAKGSVKDAAKNGVKVTAPSSVTVSAGESKEIQPAIHVPTNAEPGRYEGYIHFVNVKDAEENYQIPFSVRYTDKGIDYVQLDRPAVATDTTKFHPYLNPFVNAIFKLKSPMKTIDVIVKDGKTGQPVGYIGSLYNAENIEPDAVKYILWAFTGAVYPFTNDPANPIGSKQIKLPDGDYTFEMIAKDNDGKTYVNDQVIIVDNKPPELTFKDYKPGFYEVNDSMYTDEDGYHALWAHANVYDSTIDLLNSKGLKLDQSANSLYYYQNSAWPSGILPVQPNGDIKFGLLPEEVETPVNLKLFPFDLATAAKLLGYNYTFVKEGTEYVMPTFNKEKVKLGDTITMTLSVNNVKKLVSGKYGVEYLKNNFEFKDVKLNQAFEKYVNDYKLNVTLDEPSITDDYWTKTVTVGASINQKEFKGFDGDTPFLDVTFKIINDESYDGMGGGSLTVNEFKYTKAGETKETTIPGFTNEGFSIIPKHSVVRGFVKPEAFSNDNGTHTKDLDQIHAKVYAKAGNGKEYVGTIDRSGQYEIHGIPVSNKDYDIYVEVPGHLTSKVTATLSKEVDGEQVGVSYRTYTDQFPAGDVNGDEVIDINDLVQVAAQYGKKHDKEDINQDGIVNEKDVRFIEKNFLKVGENAKKNAKPQAKLGNKGLEDILRALGLKPNKE